MGQNVGWENNWYYRQTVSVHATQFPGQWFNTEMAQHGFNTMKHHHVLFCVHILITGFSDEFLSSGDLTLLIYFSCYPWEASKKKPGINEEYIQMHQHYKVNSF